MRVLNRVQKLVITGLCLTSTAAFASEQVQNFSRTPASPYVSDNSTFLFSLNPKINSAENIQILDKASLSDLQIQYQNLTREYDARRDYHLTSAQEDRNHIDTMNQFSRDVVDSVKNFQMNSYKTKARTAAEKDPNLAQFKRPAQVAAAVAALYYGRPIDLKVNDDTRVSAKTHVPSKKAALNVYSSIVNSAVDYSANAPQNSSGQGNEDERYRFSLMRGVPLVLINTGVSYGTSTTAMTAFVSKEVVANLTCVVDSSRYVDPSRVTHSGQDRVSLNYALRF